MKVFGNALNGYGKISALLSFIAALCTCLILFSVGGSILTGPKYENVTSGKVETLACTGNVCSGNVLINGISVNMGNIPIGTTVGQTIQVFYTNDTPPKYSGSASPPKTLAVSLMSVGISILLVAILIGVTVTKSRTASQVFGGMTLVDQISSAFR
jgi:hypothetical protein